MQGTNGLRQLIQVHLRGAFGPQATHVCPHCGDLPPDQEASIHLLVLCPHHTTARTTMLDDLFAFAKADRRAEFQALWTSLLDNPIDAFYLLVTPSTLAPFFPEGARDISVRQALLIVCRFLALALDPPRPPPPISI